MKLGLIIMAFVVLALSSLACNEVTPGDGQVSDAITEANGAIIDTATEIKDAVGGDTGIEIDTHGTVIIDELWEIAKDIHEGGN
jgi:hypothetical protein